MASPFRLLNSHAASPERSVRQGSEKSGGLLRQWVTHASSDGLEVQRLSKMAIKERRRQPHRWRIVSGGLVVAVFATREELDAELSRMRGSTGRPAGTTLEIPSPDRRASYNSDIDTPRVGLISPTRDLSVAIDGEEPTSKGLTSDAFEEDPKLALELPVTPSHLAHNMASKSQLGPEDREARRHDHVKPPQPEQEPTGPLQDVLGWFYDEDSKTWSCRELQVRIAEEPFAEGAMRVAYKMMLREDAEEREYVAKKFGPVTERDIIAPKTEIPNAEMILAKSAILHNLHRQKDPAFAVMFGERVLPDDCAMTALEFRTWYKRLILYKGDIEMQGFCQTYAKAYNSRKPPKKVVFLDAFLIVCHKDPKQPTYACEPLIKGKFEKYNNNSGEVRKSQHERNTPQAFSHFTYIYSEKQHIIVDIQGVGDTYTDPQVHSLDRHFGLGNLKQEGIDAFFKTHRCNNICRGLGLMEKGKTAEGLGTVYHSQAPALEGLPNLGHA